MNFVATVRRPKAAEVRPGSELYERIIRALRGEYQWERTYDLKRAESRLKEYHSCAVANVDENSPVPFRTRYSENLPDVETPRLHHVYNGAVENNEQTIDVPSTESNTISSTNSTRMMKMDLSSVTATSVVMKSPPATLVDNHDAQAVQCSVAQKLQKISQVDQTTCSAKPKPQSKYKPPYKMEKNHRPIISTKNLKQTEICCDPSSGKMTYRLYHSSDNQSSLEQPVTRRLQKIVCMSEEELATIELLLEKAEEVVCSLYFSNGSWQLREAEIVKASKKSVPTEVDGICISIALKKDDNLSSKHLFVPLDSSQSILHKWSRRILCALMANEKCSKVCYGAQEIVEILYTHFSLSITDNSNKKVSALIADCLQWRLLDVQVGCWLLDPDHPPHSYADCCKLLSTDYPISDKGDVDREQLLCTDMLTLVTVMSTLCSRLKSSELWQLYNELEVKIIPLLAVMQSTGIHLDTNKLLQYSDLIKTRMTMIEMEAHKMAGHSFLLSSTHQLRLVLFDELALHEKCQRSLSKTASQKFTSTSENVLTQLQDVHPLPRLILEYRQFAKTKSTYIDGIFPYISNEGILRPFWVHTGTATGRLVSINPNIQAFPKQPINLGVVKPSFIAGKDDVGVEIFIREAVESRKDYSFLSADFKSIELRVLAHFSCDDGLLKVLHQSDHHNDVFISLACYWLHVKADQVSSAEREKTKRVVYAVVYGIGKDKLADILNIHPSHAKELMESFLAQFPGVQMFIQNTIVTCKKQGYVTTLMNRRRYFPNINNDNFMNRSHAERQAVNFVIQGSAADICKTAMLRVMETLTQFTCQAKLLLQIHDELLFEIPTNDLQKLADIIHTSLESHKEILTVPLHVRISTGQTWASLKPLN